MNLVSLNHSLNVAFNRSFSVIFLTFKAALTLFKVFSLRFTQILTACLRVLRRFRCLIAFKAGVDLLLRDFKTLKKLAKILILL